jgi:hypothetical protein
MNRISKKMKALDVLVEEFDDWVEGPGLLNSMRGVKLL